MGWEVYFYHVCYVLAALGFSYICFRKIGHPLWRHLGLVPAVLLFVLAAGVYCSADSPYALASAVYGYGGVMWLAGYGIAFLISRLQNGKS